MDLVGTVSLLPRASTRWLVESARSFCPSLFPLLLGTPLPLSSFSLFFPFFLRFVSFFRFANYENGTFPERMLTKPFPSFTLSTLTPYFSKDNDCPAISSPSISLRPPSVSPVFSRRLPFPSPFHLSQICVPVLPFPPPPPHNFF